MTVQNISKLSLVGLTVGVMLFFFAFELRAQNVTVNPGGGSYATLKAAFDAVNIGTHQGAVTINVVGNTNETASAILNASGSGAASYSSINIQPVGNRTIIGTVASNAALIHFNGADNIVIDGLRSAGNSLLITSSQTNAQAVVLFSNSANNNAIFRSDIRGSNNANGVVLFGSDANGSSGNDNNRLEDNDIGAASADLPLRAVYCLGNANSDANGNQNGVLHNNRIHDAFSTTQNSALIEFGLACNQWSVTNNRLFQTEARSLSNDVRHTFLALNSSANQGNFGFTIENNVLGFAAANEVGSSTFTGGGKISGIDIISTQTGATNTIQFNRIQAITLTSTAAGIDSNTPFAAIMLRGGPASVLGNTIGSQTINQSIQLNLNNILATELYGILINAERVVDVVNNHIGGIAAVNTGAAANVSFVMRGIYNTAATARGFMISSNTIGGDLQDSISATSNASINAVNGIGSIRGFTNISQNTIRNLMANGGTGNGIGAPVSGIAINANTERHYIDGNKIYALRAVHPSLSSRVIGVFLNSATQSEVSRNEISRLEALSSNASTEVVGIVIAFPFMSVRNNMVSLGANADGSPNNADRIFIGISEVGSNNRILHNSVLIHGNVNAATRNTIAFDSSQTSPTKFYLNNVFSNQRGNTSAADTGKHFAIRVNAAPGASGFISDFNNLHAPGVGGFVASANGNSYSNLTQWQSFTLQDVNSVSLDPQFVSSDDLHLNAASSLRNAGTVLPDADFDFDRQLRPGANASVDLGADEFDGSSALTLDASIYDIIEPGLNSFRLTGANFIPQARVKNLGNQVLQNLSVRARVFNPLGTAVYDQSVSLTVLPVGAIGQVVFPSLNLPTTGLHSVRIETQLLGDVLPSNDALETPLTILSAPLGGVITVGAGGDFSSLTNSGGVFNALSTVGANANIELQIISDLLNETGLHAMPKLTAGIQTLIRPTGAARHISGEANQALIRLNGSENITIDGSTLLATSPAQLGGVANLRELTISNQADAFGAVIWVNNTNGSSNNVVLRNLKIEGRTRLRTTYGVLVSSSAFEGGATNNNTRMENCQVEKTAIGFASFGGNGASASNGTQVERSDFSAIGESRLGRIGIHINNQTNALLRHNRIGNFDSDRSADMFGITVGNSTISLINNGATNNNNVVVDANSISGLRLTNKAFGVTGLLVSGTNGNRVSNNMVSDLQANGAFEKMLAGIYVAGPSGASIEIVHNSVHLFGDRGSDPDLRNSFALAAANVSSAHVIRNNILVNRATSSEPLARNLVLGINGSNVRTISADHNIYFKDVNNPVFAITGNLNSGTIINSLGVWQTTTLQDADAVLLNPQFLADNDLHLSTGPIFSPAINAASVLASITQDIDTQTRNASERDIGADEVTVPSFGSLSVTPEPLNFGSVIINTSSAAQLMTFSADSAGAVQINDLVGVAAPYARVIGGTCAAIYPLVIAANSSCTMAFQFSPTQVQAYNVSINILRSGTGASSLSLQGAGLAIPANLLVSTNTLNFSATQVGLSSATQNVTLSNTGGLALTIESLSNIVSPFVRDPASTCTTTAPFVINAHSSCSLIIRFVPTQIGMAQQVVSVNAGAAGTASLTLNGSGIQGQLTISTTALQFGVVPNGTSSALQTITLSNLGTAALELQLISGLGVPFEISANSSCLPLPKSLALNETCDLNIRMVPLVVGVFQQTASLQHNGNGATQFGLEGEAQSIDAIFTNGFETATSQKSIFVFDPKSVESIADLLTEQPVMFESFELSDGSNIHHYIRLRDGEIVTSIVHQYKNNRPIQQSWQAQVTQNQ